MSAAALPVPHAQDVVEAMAHDTPVVVFCMSCARSKKFDPYLIAAKLGRVPFGMLVSAFPCKQCEERLAVVLPWYAPTPKEWVKIARSFRDKKPEEEIVRVDGTRFAYRIDLWKSNKSDILRQLGFVDNLMMVRAAFSEAVKQYPMDYLTMRQGAHLLGESTKPDLKVVD